MIDIVQFEKNIGPALPRNFNNNWMTAVIGRSRHVTGWTTLWVVGGRIQDLDPKICKSWRLNTLSIPNDINLIC